MIYIIAPHSLQVNITSHNRIFSFYNSLKKRKEVKVIFPSPAFNMHWFTDQVKEAVPENPDFITLKTRLNPIQKFAFKTGLYQKYRWLWYTAYIVHYLVYFKDIYYSNKELTAYLKTVGITEKDTLIVSGPPFSFFDEALKAAKNSGCMLILDYRDPWNYGYMPVYRNPFWERMIRFFERRIENRMLSTAAAANCVHAKIRDCFPRKFRSKIHVVQNGSNADFIDADSIEKHPEKFKIIYLGTIHNAQLNNEGFFQGIVKLISDKKIKAGRLELVFAGTARNKRLHQLLKKYKLEDFSSVTDRMNIADVMKESYSAAAFLHLKYQGRKTVYPSKHTDYLALQKAILLPQTDDGVLADSITENNAGYACKSFDEFYNALLELWSKYEKGENMKIERGNNFLYSISREHEAERLAAIIERLVYEKETAPVMLSLLKTEHIPLLKAAR